MSIYKNVIILLVALVLIQCTKENKYLVEKGKVGYLNTKTTMNDLSKIFENDSIVTSKSNMEDENLFLLNDNEYIIFSKDGEKILEIEPVILDDSLSTIKCIQIFDTNYKTEKGISLKSTFKDINQHYLVNKVETTLTSATLFIDELNATIAIDKKELGLSPFNRDQIALEQIPDMAKVKYFTIWFN